MTYRKKLIEVALPLEAINKAAAREKSIRHGHPSTLHLWWARRPLAAARAVLFAQLVDDPSAWPERFPTEAAQEKERQRLFRIIEDLVQWENSNNPNVLRRARLEIARSHASRWKADAEAAQPGLNIDLKILMVEPTDKELAEYLATALPPVHDPFAGGGTIPLEAQRLGLRAIASDLNPVAVLINKALIEIPPRFAGNPPVNPEGHQKAAMKTWKGAQGLAEDVRHYGKWMRDEAFRRIRHLYPEVELPNGGGKATVIAWLWARTVASPNPALGGAHVPLVSTFWLSKKPGKETWIEPVVEKGGKSYRFEIRTGKPKDPEAIDAGTKLGRGANFRCVISGAPIEPDYIKAEGMAGRMVALLMAIVAEGKRGRIYLPPSEEHERIARSAKPMWKPEQNLPDNPRWFSPPDYGMPTYADLFTPRQLVALTTFSDLVLEARERVVTDAKAAGLADDGTPLRDGGTGAAAYGDAVGTYLACVTDKLAEAGSTICTWSPAAKNELVVSTFRRQALPMTWDFAETNPFATSSGGFVGTTEYVCKVVSDLRGSASASAAQVDAATVDAGCHAVVSTDPPYYDNIGYADLSDFFYVWLRRTLRDVFPAETSTVLVPKQGELVATPYRHGGKEQAEAFFLDGMKRALRNLVMSSVPDVPATIYYAFKQAETTEAGTASTGWETFLSAAVDAGFAITGTWPLRTERGGRSNDIGTNALASSVVLVCTKRDATAGAVTRGDFRRALRDELPAALKALQRSNIAPVDVAQAAIGPGMAIFSRYEKVIEADGSAMTVRSALQLINEALDEYLSAQEGDADADTRFAVTWFEQHGWEAGKYGDAETLAKARNVAVSGIVEAGIAHAGAGKVRLLKRGELPTGWDPTKDSRLTVWEATQHLIKRLEEQGEEAAAALMKQLGPVADQARDLAYRLYSTCEKKGWAEDARAYNGLVIAWPELEKLAAAHAAPAGDTQLGLGLGGAPPAPARAAKKKATRARAT